LKLKKVLTAAMALALVATTAFGCASGKNEESGDKTPDASKPPVAQEITLNLSAEPPALDVSKATTNASFTIQSLINEGLYRLDNEQKIVEGLADGMPQISEDGLVYTIKLKKDLVWADGTPLTAHDFVYSFKRTLNPETKAEYAMFLEWIKGGAAAHAAKDAAEFEELWKQVGVVAKDDYTLEITLEKPVGFFTQMLAFVTFFPQNEAFVEAQGEKNGGDVANTLGAGPFKLQTWNHEQSLVLVKNDKYWDAENVKLEKITINIVKDNQTALNLFETGATDVTTLSGDAIAAYVGKPEYTVKQELTNAYIMFQQSKFAPFANAKIRAALALAIDRDTYVNVVLKNGSVAATGFVPNGTLDGNNNQFRKTAGDTLPAYNPEKAQQLLKEGLAELGLESLPSFKLTADDTEGAKKMLEFILAQWKQNLGVEAVAEPLPFQLRVERQKAKDYEALIALWGADYNDPMTFLDLWLSDSPFNYIDWKNAEYDAKVKAADVEVDPAKRAQLLVDAEKILMDEMAVAPLYFRNTVYAVNTKVKNLGLPSYGNEWELKWTYIE